MTTTATTAAPRTADPGVPVAPATARSDIGARAAGLGAVAFAGIVILQNIIRGASAPANDATAREVLDHYASHRGITVLLIATYVLSGAGLAAFLGGARGLLARSTRPGWATTGFVGALGVLATFTVVVAAEQAVSVVAAGDHPDLGAVQALWAFHNSAFAVLDLMIAIALVGLARAGVAAGVTPRVFERIAPVGAGLLAVGAFFGPYVAAGEAMPAFGAAGIGFLLWLAFLVATGLRLVRQPA